MSGKRRPGNRVADYDDPKGPYPDTWLCGYIALNPVRAQMVHSAKEWRWSSYRATAGYDESDACLITEWILAGFAETKDIAQQRYRDFVQEGKGQIKGGQIKGVRLD